MRIAAKQWGYAVDIAILWSRNYVNTISALVQEAMCMVQQWCDRTQLCISAQRW